MRKSIYLLALCSITALSLADKAPAQEQEQPTAAQLSAKATPASAILRIFESQIYEFRSAAEAMPEDKWDYRPAPGQFKNEKPDFGPAEMRTFRAQVKH